MELYNKLLQEFLRELKLLFDLCDLYDLTFYRCAKQAEYVKQRLVYLMQLSDFMSQALLNDDCYKTCDDFVKSQLKEKISQLNGESEEI